MLNRLAKLVGIDNTTATKLRERRKEPVPAIAGIESLEERCLLAATYIVDPTGGGDFTTIQAGIDALTAGDTLRIKAGTYRESVRANITGTALERITIEPFDTSEGDVIIKGSDVFTNWTFDQNITGGKRYKTSVDYAFVESVPGPTWATELSKRTDMVFFGDTMFQQELNLSDLDPNEFYVSDADTTRDLYIGLPTGTTPSDDVIEISVRQKGFHTDWVNFNTGQNSDYLTIKGITVTHVASTNVGGGGQTGRTGAIRIAGDSNLLEDSQAIWNNYAGIKVSLTNSQIINSEASFNGNTGMDGSPQNVSFIGNTTNNNGWRFGPTWHAGGMKFVGLHEQIRNNTIDGAISNNNNGPGLWFDTTAGNTTIKNSIFSNNTHGGIKLEAIYESYGGFKVYNNIVSSTQASIFGAPFTGGMQEDGSGILLVGSGNNEIYNNTIVGNARQGIAVAGNTIVLTNSVTKNNTIRNNIFYDNGEFAINLHPWGDGVNYINSNTFDNNIYYNTSSSNVDSIGGNRTQDQVILWYDTNAPSVRPQWTLAEFVANTTNGDNSFQADPKFINVGDSDYRLLPGSLAIDNATDEGISSDIIGTTRPQGNGFDIGAYEFADSIGSVRGYWRLEEGSSGATASTLTSEVFSPALDGLDTPSVQQTYDTDVVGGTIFDPLTGLGSIKGSSIYSIE